MDVTTGLGGRRQGPDLGPFVAPSGPSTGRLGQVGLMTSCLACAETHEREGPALTPHLPVVPGKLDREQRDSAGGGRVSFQDPNSWPSPPGQEAGCLPTQSQFPQGSLLQVMAGALGGN